MPQQSPAEILSEIQLLCSQYAETNDRVGRFAQALEPKFRKLAACVELMGVSVAAETYGDHGPQWKPEDNLAAQARELIDSSDTDDEFDNADEIIPVEQYGNKA